jgi:hypothetical protein
MAAADLLDLHGLPERRKPASVRYQGPSRRHPSTPRHRFSKLAGSNWRSPLAQPVRQVQITDRDRAAMRSRRKRWEA